VIPLAGPSLVMNSWCQERELQVSRSQATNPNPAKKTAWSNCFNSR